MRPLTCISGGEIIAAVKTAVRERLDREARQRGKASPKELPATANRIAGRTFVDACSLEEIIGHDGSGSAA